MARPPLALTQARLDQVMQMARPSPRADLKKQESRWACAAARLTSMWGLTGPPNPYLKPAQTI